MEARSGSRGITRVSSVLIALLIVAVTTLPAPAAAQVDIAQRPLHLGPRVPGNLALVPSVEYPTINSAANLGPYDANRPYTGYFDADKCYHYHYSAIEADRHFYPVRFTLGHACSSSRKEWSGNFMNWAVTQTIDPFRLALTGGYRVRDTPTETWLEKARHDRPYGFWDRRMDGWPPDVAALRTATPASWNWMWINVQGQGNRMRFTGRNHWGAIVPYDPATHDLVLDNLAQAIPAGGLEVSVRVKVCVANLLEANCRRYSQGWKPEGLIQQYSDRVRYSIFGYLNESSIWRDGGVLRANQKFVGPQTHDPVRGRVANPASEWDADTGVIHGNPDPAAAAATPGEIRDSGVINYLNKFGQLTWQPHKGVDPVSELYYTAIRYFKGQGNVAAYSAIGTGNAYHLADGFPVVTRWDDPIQYRCQANVILGIGDVYSHRDKNLPGNTNRSEEPSTPPEVLADTSVDVVAATGKVAELEGLRITTPFSGRNNSAYIAGLAYDSHAKDIRPDLKGKQTIATYWVDVRENGVLAPRALNQYWLAAKYGGFRVPDDFRPYERKAALPESWWNESGDVLATGDKRPDNFYVASEADKMVESLTGAFSRILSESGGSAASLASSTARLEAGAMIYQARFYSPSWRGELHAHAFDRATGEFAGDPVWSAGDRLLALPWESRKIHVHNPQATAGRRYGLLRWEALGPAQQSVLGDEATVDYLRGDRGNEGRLRIRQGVLGDIVHSQPVFVGRPDLRMHYGAKFNGASLYAAFAERQSARRGVVYVGANDGMLHGFDASTGDEVYAFMPAAAINAQLRKLTSPAYEHRFFVDGELSVADVYSSSDGRWKSILVGSMGRGGRSIFALDVTDPDDVRFLWEKGAPEIPALGNVLGKPIIAQVANGDWRVLLGNGPNSSTGTAQLVTIGIESGSVQTTTTGVSGDNGLSAVDAWDGDGDGFHETVYGGDLAGNLWRFEHVGSAMASASRLFAATDAAGKPQPITAAPFLLRDPQARKLWVYVGTGRYLGDRDAGDRGEQTWYGMIDDGDAVAGRAALVARRILAEVATGNDRSLRVTSPVAAGDLSGKDGWLLDLVSPLKGREGERMVVPNRNARGLLIGTTRIPDASDVCSPGGRGFVMAVDPFTGSRPSSGAFDANGDRQFDRLDTVEIGGMNVPASGVGYASSPNGPLVLDDTIEVNLDDGARKTQRTRSTGRKASRISWRELLLH